MAAVDEHTAHAQADSESLRKPYCPVPAVTFATSATGDAEHKHSQCGENTASGAKLTMMTRVKKPSGNEGSEEDAKRLRSPNERDESRVGLPQKMAQVI